MQKLNEHAAPVPEENADAVDRRRLLRRAGGLLAAGGALAALAQPASADTNSNELDGLWQSVVSAADSSFAPFKAFEIYGGGLWIGSGQTDLTPALLESSLWGVFT